MVDALPDGVQRQVAATGGSDGHWRLVLSGARDAARLRERRTFSEAGLAPGAFANRARTAIFNFKFHNVFFLVIG